MSLTYSRLLCFPGIAADERLFDRQRDAFPDLLVAPWLTPRRAEPVGAYVARQLDALGIDAARVRAGDEPPVIPFGQSFGGWLGIAAAAHLGSPLVLIIANAPVPEMVSDEMQRKVAQLSALPHWAIMAFARTYKAFLAARCAARRLPPRDLSRMPLGFPARMLLWSGLVMSQPLPEPPPGCCVRRGYARHDPVVRYERLPSGHTADLVVETDSHIFNHTNADEVNAWIRRTVAEALHPANATNTEPRV
ncbi:MAG: hypothetical protein AAGI30_12945 [Planctomycetota bacterium]